MPKKHFSLEFGKAPSLEISWNGGWFLVINNIVVKYAGGVVGTFQHRFELEKGQQIQLPNGGLLNIRLVANHFEIFYNQQSVQEITNATGNRNFSFLLGATLFLYGIWDFVEVRMLWEAIIHCGIGLGYIAFGLVAQKNYSWSSWGIVLLSMVYIAILRVIEPIQSDEHPYMIGILALLIMGLSIFIKIFAKYFRTTRPE